LLVRCEHFGGFDAKILTCNIIFKPILLALPS
jgi:hypothetical protein